MTEYKTVRSEACDEFVERRSRFIGYAKPVTTGEGALSFLQEIRTKHWDASHHVYAYVLRDGQVRRYSDDGEPQGTAGIPVLEVLTKSGVTDAAVVVVRYFGGTLLGTGGLVRAYSHGASLALKKARIVTMRRCLLLELSCSYAQYGSVAALIPECGGSVDHADFTDVASLSFHMAEEDCAGFHQRLADLTCGSVSFRAAGEKYFEFLQEK